MNNQGWPDERCATCGLRAKLNMGVKNDGPLYIRLRPCSRCKEVRYCNRECQMKDWKAGHKDKCVVPGDKPPPPMADELRSAVAAQIANRGCYILAHAPGRTREELGPDEKINIHTIGFYEHGAAELAIARIPHRLLQRAGGFLAYVRNERPLDQPLKEDEEMTVNGLTFRAAHVKGEALKAATPTASSPSRRQQAARCRRRRPRRADEDDEAQLARLPYSDEERARDDRIFARLLDEAAGLEGSPLLGPAVQSQILKSEDLADAVGEVLACRLARAASCIMLPRAELKEACVRALRDDPKVGADVTAILARDPAAISYLQTASRALGRRHPPGASLGGGLLMDHATGIVIGETAVIGDNCTILHSVTLGGTGKDRGDRHPKVGDRCTLGAGATVLGNIRVGDGATVGSQAVVTRTCPRA
ncbi:serine O-acetyltransferase [Aureococcus anophagefferens]|nr:serine O-acetyltransferase [Aureococcus anophagefferens]